MLLGQTHQQKIVELKIRPHERAGLIFIVERGDALECGKVKPHVVFPSGSIYPYNLGVAHILGAGKSCVTVNAIRFSTHLGLHGVLLLFVVGSLLDGERERLCSSGPLLGF